MKKNRVFLIAMCIICAAAVLFTFAGCSASTNESYDNGYITQSSDSYFSTGDDLSSYEPDFSPESDGAYEKNESGTLADGDYERKIIKNADVSIECDDAAQCYEALLSKASSLGGYESYCNVRRNESSYGKSVSYEIVIKIAPEKLDEFVSSLSDYGEVTYYQVSEDEITEQYYDIVTRLESKEKALDRYYELLDEAKDIYQVLEIQRYIDQLTEEIESLKGTLRYYDSKVDESTVNISIYQFTEAPDAPEDFEWDSLTFENVGKYIKNGFLGVLNFVWSLLQWVVIIVAAGSPILIPLAVVLFFVIRKRKRTKAERDAKKAESKAKVYDAPKYGENK